MFQNSLSRRWKVAIVAVAAPVVFVAAGFGGVSAVTIEQTVKSVMGARASTSAFTTVTATHVGSNVAKTNQAGTAASGITPSATDATTEVRAAAVAAGEYVYSIKFESTATDDDLPAGTVRARWTTAGTEQQATLPVTAATVGVGAKGGFTLVIPGSASDTPENIQLVFEQ